MNNNIKMVIKNNNINISNVIENTGLSRSYFYDVMNGRSVPSLPVARRISKVLNVRLDELFPDESLIRREG